MIKQVRCRADGRLSLEMILEVEESLIPKMVKGGVAERFPATGQTLVVRPYVKKVMRRRDNRISFNLFDEATGTYAHIYYAFADPMLSVELHKGNGHRVRFDSDPMFPQFLERIESVELPKPVRKRKAANTATA